MPKSNVFESMGRASVQSRSRSFLTKNQRTGEGSRKLCIITGEDDRPHCVVWTSSAEGGV